MAETAVKSSPHHIYYGFTCLGCGQKITCRWDADEPPHGFEPTCGGVDIGHHVDLTDDCGGDLRLLYGRRTLNAKIICYREDDDESYDQACDDMVPAVLHLITPVTDQHDLEADRLDGEL